MISAPFNIAVPKNVFLYESTRLQPNVTIINYTGCFYLKKYSAVGYGMTAITGNHIPTVGIPQFLLGMTHINDKETDIVIEEDVWLGANITLLAGCHIGRGAVVGSSALVNKCVPPYAVVAGVPSKIIACKFTIDEIIVHEKKLYSSDERFSRDFLDKLFHEYYVDKKAMGISTLSKKDLENLKRFKEYTHVDSLTV